MARNLRSLFSSFYYSMKNQLLKIKINVFHMTDEFNAFVGTAKKLLKILVAKHDEYKTFSNENEFF